MIEKIKSDSNFRPTRLEIRRFNEEQNEKREKSYCDASAKREPTSQPLILDVLLMPPDWTTNKITHRKVCWYVAQGWTNKKIAVELNSSAERIQKVLDREASSKLKPKKPEKVKELPFGWKNRDGQLEPDTNEQWVLEKMAKDHSEGKTGEEIAKNLEKLGIKPKGGGVWFEKRVLRAIELNQHLLKAWKRGDDIER